MTALYLHEDAKELLAGKTLVVLGDSVERSVYKDLVCLLQENRYLTDAELRKKGELSFYGDELIYGGVKGEQKNSINYRECRYFKSDYEACCRYYFVTICYGDYVEEILQELSLEPTDVIVMNSCLWDVHRHGRKGIENYEENLEKLVLALRRLMPDCVFLWLTTPPVALQSKGGFLSNPGQENVKIQEVKYCNEIAREVFTAADNIYGTFKVVDLDYVFQYFEHHRASDGVHWNERAHRRMSNMILEELSKYYSMKVPRVLDDFGVRTEQQQQQFFPPQSRNPWADDDRSDFWSNERIPAQNGWDFEANQRGAPRMRLPVQGYPFMPRNMPQPIKFGMPGAPGPSFDPRAPRMPILNDLDDLGHARHHVESQLENRKRKRNSIGDESDKPPEKQYRFGVQCSSSTKRKADESHNEPVKKMKIEEIDGKLKKLVDLGDGVTIHLPLNEKEKEVYRKEQVEKERKIKLAEEKKNLEAKKKLEEDLKKKCAEEKRAKEKKKQENNGEWIIKDEIVVSDAEKKKKGANEEKPAKEVTKADTVDEWIVTDEVIVDGEEKETVADEEKIKNVVTENKELASKTKEVNAKPRKIFLTRQRRSKEKAKMEVDESTEVECKPDVPNDEEVSVQPDKDNKAVEQVVPGDEKEAVDVPKALDSNDVKVIPLEEAMKNVSELPLVSSVPEGVDEKEKSQRKVLVPTRRSSRLSKSASKLLNLIKTPVQELLGKVPSTPIEKKPTSNAEKSTSLADNNITVTETSNVTTGVIVDPKAANSEAKLEGVREMSSVNVDKTSSQPISVSTSKVKETVTVSLCNSTNKYEVLKSSPNLKTDHVPASSQAVTASTQDITSVSKEGIAPDTKKEVKLISKQELPPTVKSELIVPPKQVVTSPIKHNVASSSKQEISTTNQDATSMKREITTKQDDTSSLKQREITTQQDCTSSLKQEITIAKQDVSSSTKQEITSTAAKVTICSAPISQPKVVPISKEAIVASTKDDKIHAVKSSIAQPVYTTPARNMIVTSKHTSPNDVTKMLESRNTAVTSSITTGIYVQGKRCDTVTTSTRTSLLPSPFAKSVDTATNINRLHPVTKTSLLDKPKLIDARSSLTKTVSVVKPVVTCTINSTTVGKVCAGSRSVLNKVSIAASTNPGTLNTKISAAPIFSSKMSLPFKNVPMAGNKEKVASVSVSSVTAKIVSSASVVEQAVPTKSLSTTVSAESSLNGPSMDQPLINVSPRKVDTLALLSMPSPFAKPKPRQQTSVALKLPSAFDQPSPSKAASVAVSTNSNNISKPTQPITLLGKKDSASSNNERHQGKSDGKENILLNSVKVTPSTRTPIVSSNVTKNKISISEQNKETKVHVNTSKLPIRNTEHLPSSKSIQSSNLKEDKNSSKTVQNTLSLARTKSISEDVNEDLLLSEADVTDDLSDLDESILEDSNNTSSETVSSGNYKWTAPNRNNDANTTTTGQMQQNKISSYSNSQNNVNQHLAHTHPNNSTNSTNSTNSSVQKYPLRTAPVVQEANISSQDLSNSDQVKSSATNEASPGDTTPVKEKKKIKKYPNETKEEKRARRQAKRDKKERRLKEKEEKKKLLANAVVTQESVENNYNWNVPLQQNSQPGNSQPPQRVRSATWAPSYYPTYDKDSKRSVELHKRLAPQNYTQQPSQQPPQQQYYNQQRQQQHHQQQKQQQPHQQQSQPPVQQQFAQQTVPQVKNPASAAKQNTTMGGTQDVRPISNQSQHNNANPPVQGIHNTSSEIPGTPQHPMPNQTNNVGVNQHTSKQQNSVQLGQQQTLPELPKQKMQPQQQNASYPAQQPAHSQPSNVHSVKSGMPNIIPSEQPQQSIAQSLSVASQVTYQQPTYTISRPSERSNLSRPQPAQQQGLLPTQKRAVPASVQRINTVNTSISHIPQKQIQTVSKPNQVAEPLQAIQTLSKSAPPKHLSQPSKTSHIINQPAHGLNHPYQQTLHSHVYQQPQHLIHQHQHSTVIAQQQQHQLIQQQQQLMQQNAAAQSSAHKQLYIDEYGQTYTLEEETYIVDASGQIQNISSATSAYMQQQQLQQPGVQLQQQGVQQYAIQSSLLYSHQQQSGYI